jgi:CRISPR-associated exonuclease Cas4
MIWLIVLLFAAGLGLLWLASRQRKATGLPGGKLIYSDTERWGKLEKPLYAPALGLTGKPDYLVEQDGKIIPIEVKTSRPAQGPYDSHVFQLAAYCLLVTQVYGKRPNYGIIHYTSGGKGGQTYAVEFTQDLESAVLATIQQMQTITLRKGVDRSHEQPQRCARCGYRNTCDQVCD